MNDFVHFYELRSFQDLNAQTTNRQRRGALLKVVNAAGVAGYADIHPWPELGDPELERVLSDRTALFQRAQALAKMDQQARVEGIFLQAGPLKSHRLVRDMKMSLDTAGHDAIFKIKCGAQLPMETERLRGFVLRMQGLQRLRLDFNESLTPANFDIWMTTNSDWLLGRLDFIEDPCPFDRLVYKKWRSLIAFDRVPMPSDMRVEVKVVKPVYEDVETMAAFMAGQIERVVFTHNMDHPLGQRAARVCASQFYDRYPKYVDVGGLESFDGYHLRDENISQPQDRETGLGFDRYLSELAWTPL